MPAEIRSVDALTPAVQDAVRALARRAEQADDVAPLSEQPLLSLAVGRPEIAHLIAVAGDDADQALRADDLPREALLGYAQVDLRGATASAELVVDPSARRRGTGSALLAAVRGNAPGPLAVWAHGDLPGARALARSAGMNPVRELWKMQRDLTEQDAAARAPLPADVRVHPFRPGVDEERWLAVNARAFADHPEQGRLTRADLDARMAEPWFEAGDLLLVEQDGPEPARPVAFLWLKVLPGDPTGELYVLGVDPSAQGRGLGGALTARALTHLRERGCDRVVLYVDGGNTPAIRAYQRAGFTRAALDVQYAPSEG